MILTKKEDLLKYYRDRASELIYESNIKYSNNQYKEKVSFINKGLSNSKNNLIKIIEQDANISKYELLEYILMITYTNIIVMIESRNKMWEYEYMTFSRRIGELWEPFCRLCWDYKLNNNITFFTPPLFSEIKKSLSKEVYDFIDSLNISDINKNELKSYYRKIWSLVSSGEIKLELDLHFIYNNIKYVIDFKSGFGSNEKGNTNRLLLIGSIYNILKETYKCIIFVRSENNNNYLDSLQKSNLWEVYTGTNTYQLIYKITGFDLTKWISNNIDWENDFTKEMYKFIKNKKLHTYLKW